MHVNLQETLIIEKRTLEDEKKTEAEINRWLNMEMNEQLYREDKTILQQKVTSTKVKVYNSILLIQ